MKLVRSLFEAALVLALAGAVGCGKTEPAPVGTDAAPDGPQDLRADADGGAPDLGAEVQPAVKDAQSLDCSLIGCPQASVDFTVPDFHARFGADSRLIDVSACYGPTCASARVTLAQGSSSVMPTSSGEAAVTALVDQPGGALRVTLSVPTDDAAEGAVREVSVKIVTTSGRGLVDYKTSAAVETYCPNGSACGPVCRRIRVALDQGDGGRPLDGPDPTRAGGGTGRTCAPTPPSTAPATDGPVEATPFCSSCAADEICVVFHDGVCGSPRPSCRKKTAGCTAATCSQACNRDLCGSATCMAAPCPETALFPQALHCYGV
jgi:hypothetical protein